MTVGQLLDNISSLELSEWMALKRLEAREQKEQELATRARAAEQKLRGNRSWRR